MSNKKNSDKKRAFTQEEVDLARLERELYSSHNAATHSQYVGVPRYSNGDIAPVAGRLVGGSLDQYKAMGASASKRMARPSDLEKDGLTPAEVELLSGSAKSAILGYTEDSPVYQAYRDRPHLRNYTNNPPVGAGSAMRSASGMLYNTAEVQEVRKFTTQDLLIEQLDDLEDQIDELSKALHHSVRQANRIMLTTRRFLERLPTTQVAESATQTTPTTLVEETNE